MSCVFILSLALDFPKSPGQQASASVTPSNLLQSPAVYHTPALEVGDWEISPWFHHKASLPTLVCACVNREQCETVCAWVCAYTHTGGTGKKRVNPSMMFLQDSSTMTLLIFGARSFLLWGCLVHCRIFSSVPDLHQLDARSSPTPHASPPPPPGLWQPSMCPDIDKCSLPHICPQLSVTV